MKKDCWREGAPWRRLGSMTQPSNTWKRARLPGRGWCTALGLMSLTCADDEGLRCVVEIRLSPRHRSADDELARERTRKGVGEGEEGRERGRERGGERERSGVEDGVKEGGRKGGNEGGREVWRIGGRREEGGKESERQGGKEVGSQGEG